MRITLKLASAGNGCIFRYPGLVDESFVKTNGAFDERLCRQQLAALQTLGYCLGSSGDRRNAIIVTTSFLYNLKECADKMVADAKAERDAGDRAAPHAFADSPADRRASKKLDHGDNAFVRIDVKDSWPVRIRVSWANPDGGDMQDEWCKDVALLCLEVADAMAQKAVGKLVAVEGSGCSGFIARARAEERRRAEAKELKRINEQRFFCERRTASGHCSPCNFSCPNFQNGLCTEAKELKP